MNRVKQEEYLSKAETRSHVNETVAPEIIQDQKVIKLPGGKVRLPYTNRKKRANSRNMKAQGSETFVSMKGGDATSREIKRYNLALPKALFDEVQRIADARQTTVVDLLRRFIRLGLLAIYLEDKPDAALIIREGDSEREVLLL